MGKKINDAGEFPSVEPESGDRVLGIDTSNTGTDPNGAVVTFPVNDLFGLQASDIGVTIQAHSEVLDGTTASYTTAEETKLAGISASATAGVVILSTTTASNDTAVDIALTGGYSRYQIRLDHVTPATDDVTLNMRLSTDGASFIATSNYAYAYSLVGLGLDTAGTGTGGIVSTNVGNGAAEGVTAVIDLFLAAGSARNRLLSDAAFNIASTGATLKFTAATELNNSTTAATDIRFLFSAGNITSGAFTLIGIPDGE